MKSLVKCDIYKLKKIQIFLDLPHHFCPFGGSNCILIGFHLQIGR